MIKKPNQFWIIATAIVIGILEILSCNAMYRRGYYDGQLDAAEGKYHWIILNDKILEVQKGVKK